MAKDIPFNVNITELKPGSQYIIACEDSRWDWEQAETLWRQIKRLGREKDFAIIIVNGIDSFKFVRIPKMKEKKNEI